MIFGWMVLWETDFYTPPVLGGAALFDNSAPVVYKNPVRYGPWILYSAGAELSKRAAPPSTGGILKFSLPYWIFGQCGSMGVERCIPRSAGEQLGRDPFKNGSSKSLVFESFPRGRNSLGLVTLTGIRLYFVHPHFPCPNFWSHPKIWVYHCGGPSSFCMRCLQLYSWHADRNCKHGNNHRCMLSYFWDLPCLLQSPNPENPKSLKKSPERSLGPPDPGPRKSQKKLDKSRK